MHRHPYIQRQGKHVFMYLYIYICILMSSTSRCTYIYMLSTSSYNHCLGNEYPPIPFCAALI